MNKQSDHGSPVRNLSINFTSELKWLYYELFKNIPCLDSCYADLLNKLQENEHIRSSMCPDSDPVPAYAASPASGSTVPLGMVLHADTFADSLSGFESRIPYLLEAGVTFLHICSFPAHEKEEEILHLFHACHQAGITVCVSIKTLFHSPAALNRTISDILFFAGAGADFMYPEITAGQRLKPPVLRILKIICETVRPSFRIVGDRSHSGIEMKYECSFLYTANLMSAIWNSVATGNVALLKYEADHCTLLPEDPLFLNYLRRQDLLNWDLDYAFLGSSGIDERVHRHFLNDFFTGIYPGSCSRGNLFHAGSHGTSSGLCGTTASFCGIEKYGFEGNRQGVSASVDLMLMLYALVFSLPGIPVVCSGDEIGMVNDYSYRRKKELLSDDRYLHHSRFRTDLAEKRHLEGTVPNRIFTMLMTLCQIRREHPGLFLNAPSWTLDTWSSSTLALVRETKAEKFIGLYNFSSETDVAWINEQDGPYTDLLSGDSAEAQGISLPPYSFRWLLKSK